MCIRGEGRQSGATSPLPSLCLPPGACAEFTLQSYQPSYPCLKPCLFPPACGGMPWPGSPLWFSPPLTSLSISPQETPLCFPPIFLAVLLWSLVVTLLWCLQVLSTCWWLLSLQLRLPSELWVCVLNWAYFPLLHSCSLSSWVSSKAQILVLILDLPHSRCPHPASHCALSGLALESCSFMFISSVLT